ncbi:MAG: OB-fold nucleic acid binding domain-containing protein, partial [Planctomycetota bacterium]
MEESRLEKLRKLEKEGINPWGGRFDKEFIKKLKEEFEEKKTVKTAGRIMACREHGKTFFLDIKDETGKIQLYFKSDTIGEGNFELAKSFDIGDIIGVSGELFKTHTGEITIFVKEFQLLSKSLRALPEKWHGLKDPELIHRKRYLDLIVNPASFETFK